MKIEIYRSGFFRRDYRWRVRAANGKILAHGGEGYRNRGDMLETLDVLFQYSPMQMVEVG